MLVTERGGQIGVIRDSMLDPRTVPGVPTVFAKEQSGSGFMDIALDSRFSENNGRQYPGPRVSEHTWTAGMEEPLVVWLSSIAVSGMTVYKGER